MEVTHGSAVRQFKLGALLISCVLGGGIPKAVVRLREWCIDKGKRDKKVV